ncbi:MAG: DUF1540 domain-containing protein [Syntrophomonas sp.]
MKSGQQTIKCNVSSCRFNESRTSCNLSSIQVAPCSHVSSGDAKDESMCASYESSR